MPQGSLFETPSQPPARKTRAPDSLTHPQIRALEEWAERTVPWLSRGALDSGETLECYIEETLDWWRGEGRTKADWVATIRNRIRTVERRRIQRLARDGSDDARLALADPVAWARQFDTRARSKPVESQSAPRIFRPSGGRVLHLQRQG